MHPSIVAKRKQQRPFVYSGDNPVGLYSKYLFPYVINTVMSNGYMKKARTAVLADVKGEVFEIGFGTGMNLPFYPDAVKRLTTVDINPGMNKLARREIDASPIEVKSYVLDGENLPMDDGTFDSVVCTWTLCSIERVDKALNEVHRVLKPGGRFFFVEHGLADDEKTRRWQHRLAPAWKIIGDGCHLNRNIEELILDSHFSFESLENYYMKKSPKFAGWTYQGVAVKS